LDGKTYVAIWQAKIFLQNAQVRIIKHNHHPLYSASLISRDISLEQEHSCNTVVQSWQFHSF